MATAPEPIPVPDANEALRGLDDILQRTIPTEGPDFERALWGARYRILQDRGDVVAEVKPYSDGDFLLYRRVAHGRHPRGLTRHAGGSRMPSFRHKTRELAEAEARRLAAKFPDSTFIILQEVGRVKLKPASADRSGAADETSTKIEGSAEGESAVPKGDAQ